MPISSPSYFPPNRGNGTIVGLTAGVSTTGARNFLAGRSAGQYTDLSDLIIIGDNAFSAGSAVAHITEAKLTGTLAIGNNAGAALTTTTQVAKDGAPYGNILLGQNAAQAATTLSGSIIIGKNAFKNIVGGPTLTPDAYVVIGGGAVENLTMTAGLVASPESCVIIGTLAAQGVAAGVQCGLQQAVIIGHGAAQQCGAAGGGVNIGRSIIIGFRAARIAGSLGNFDNNIVIGNGGGGGLTGNCSGNIAIGAGTSAVDIFATNNVALGDAVTAFGGDNNVLIGANAVGPGSHSGCIYLGASAGFTAVAASDQFIVETRIGGTQKTIFFGNLAGGNLVIGKSTQGVDRDFSGTNNLKLLNGTVGGATPAGGGFFWVDGANSSALHWKNSAGIDTALSVAAAGINPFTYLAPLVGFNATIGAGIQYLVLDPAGTLATGTVTLPASPLDGFTVHISTTQAITALTIAANAVPAGQAVADAPTTLPIGGTVSFLYRAANTTWYRVHN